MSRDQTIYVVDDDAAVRDSLTWLLEAHGFRVRTCASAEAFLFKYRQGRMRGCALIDVCLPGIGGLALYEELLCEPHPLPVIIITGSSDAPADIKRATPAAAGFIEKPFNDKAIVTLIEQCLAKASKDAKQQGLDESDAGVNVVAAGSVAAKGKSHRARLARRSSR